MGTQFVLLAVFPVEHLYPGGDAFVRCRPHRDDQVAVAAFRWAGRDPGAHRGHSLVPLHAGLAESVRAWRPAFPEADRADLDRDHHGIDELEVLVAVEAGPLDDRGALAVVLQNRKSSAGALIVAPPANPFTRST